MTDAKVTAAVSDFTGRAGLSWDPIVAQDCGHGRKLFSCSGYTYNVESSWYPLMEDCYTEYAIDGEVLPNYYSNEYVLTDGGSGGVIIPAQPAGSSQVRYSSVFSRYEPFRFGFPRLFFRGWSQQ